MKRLVEGILCIAALSSQTMLPATAQKIIEKPQPGSKIEIHDDILKRDSLWHEDAATTSIVAPAETAHKNSVYDVSNYPTLVDAVSNFENRLLASNPSIRINLIDDVGDLLPFREAEDLLMNMLKDPEVLVQLEAAIWLSELEYTLPDDFAKKLYAYKRCPGYSLNHFTGSKCTVSNCGRQANTEEWSSLQIARQAPFHHYDQAVDTLMGFQEHPDLRVRLVAANSMIKQGINGFGLSYLKNICRQTPTCKRDCNSIRAAFLSRVRMKDDTALRDFSRHLERLKQSKDPYSQHAYVVGLRTLENLHGVKSNDGTTWFFWLSDRTEDGVDHDSEPMYRPLNRSRRNLSEDSWDSHRRTFIPSENMKSPKEINNIMPTKYSIYSDWQ